MTDSPLATADWSGAIICATQCYACQFDQHPDVPHTWGAPDDFEHAWAMFQQAPGFCGCSCGRPARTVPKVRVRRGLAIDLKVPPLYSWSCPICASGSAIGLEAAVAVATQHRQSDVCRYRGVTE